MVLQSENLQLLSVKAYVGKVCPLQTLQWSASVEGPTLP